ncbi:hypothetical protein SMACR_01865 [Sordaria macrospora]|uniref:WGS project CABT00000000 data, contig 2.5 n=2 Tax=Sordaria macrospora TaxID=5147 RepID=F7VS31_SORMK|nr:uncharacterized protein SMAC_01865 [Sordaria macrospora k-hell]KAA8634055.1 hypothetical protein SMACR_01865 [Sordaria macrospora]WPJ63099.1 hypothetical protein SMAC4_01865 [Sordaria macrospora]CCC08317.1 unnamed protein product [Sordaria macrospora k-hell]
MATLVETSLPTTSSEERIRALEEWLLNLDSKYEALLKSFESRPPTAQSGERAEKAEPNISSTASEGVAPGNDSQTPRTKIGHNGHPRIKIVRTCKNPDTGEMIEKEDNPAPKTEDRDQIAFILKKLQADQVPGSDDSSEIDIISLDLWDLLKKHLAATPRHLFRGQPITMYSPFEAFVHNFDLLQTVATEINEQDNEQQKQARKDLELLLGVISGGSSGDEKLNKYFKMRDSYLSDGTIQFDDLWTIFPPGALIYGKPFQGEEQVFVVADNWSPWPRIRDHPSTWKPWGLACWVYDWTGAEFKRTPFDVKIEGFEGRKPVTSLPYYPLEFMETSELRSIKAKLTARGKKFRKYCEAKEGSRMFEYAGAAIHGMKGFTGMGQDGTDDSDSRSARSVYDHLERLRRRGSGDDAEISTPRSIYTVDRVMVDYISYFQYGPSTKRLGGLESTGQSWMDCSCSDCAKNQALITKFRMHFDKLSIQLREDWEEEQYLICPPRVLGYILKGKQWAQLQVTNLTEIPRSDDNNSWNKRLQLADDKKDGKTKSLLFDLVRSHISSSAEDRNQDRSLEVNDIVAGKGKGLIILLYGPPGVGKTSTAETIAEAARKPLFSISVADVGTEAKHVESNLARIFALATSWQAILLLDEADVFLESRGKGDSTDRNALVSVFLRVLEYYQGIMFLTTNQIAQFDVAIPSRIHISIAYKHLNEDQMKSIFKGFLDPLRDRDLIQNYEGIMEYLDEYVSAMRFDGRQIRNIVTTALALARAETRYKGGTGKLKLDHLKTVATNTNKFKDDFSLQYQRYIENQKSVKSFAT